MRRSPQVPPRGERGSGAKDAAIMRQSGGAMDEASDRRFLIPMEDVAYLFLGSAVPQGLIHSRWNGALQFRSSLVYMRSDCGTIFQTTYRTLETRASRAGRPSVPTMN